MNRRQLITIVLGEGTAYRRFSGKDFASDDLKAADRLEDQYMSTIKNVLGGLLYLPETEPMHRKAQQAAQVFKDLTLSSSVSTRSFMRA